MFTVHTTTPAASVLDVPANGVQAWMDDNHDMLLGNHDVLDYSSFSDDSHSPVLSLQSYSPQQLSPDLDAYAFSDFESLVTSSSAAASSALMQPASVMAFQPTANQVVTPADARPSASETARQAALLHAYLTSQDELYRAQLQLQQQQQQQQQQQHQKQQWNNLPVLTSQDKEQKHRVEIIDKEQEKQKQQQLEKNLAQKADAENLARYLAQMQKIKEEESSADERPHTPRDEAMDLADISAEPVFCPSSPLTISSSSERSPSPEAVSIAQQDTGATAQSTANGDNAANANTQTTNKPSRQLVCFNCQVTQTPLWRRTPDRKHSLCNACGLYYKQYGAHRPLNVRHKLSSVLIDPRLAALPYARPSTQNTRGSSPSSESDSEEMNTLPELAKFYADALLRPTAAKKTTPPLMTAKQGIACANCSQTQTPLWRKNDAGEPICNACGLYAKLHNRARPVTMRKTKITRRRRDWGGNLAHQAKAQAHALALFHAQVQAQIEAQMKNNSNKEMLDITLPSSWSFENEDDCEMTMAKSMRRRLRKINGHGRHTAFSDSEEEPPQPQSQPQPQPQSQPEAQPQPQLPPQTQTQTPSSTQSQVQSPKLQPKPQPRLLAPAPLAPIQPQLHVRPLASALPLSPVQSRPPTLAPAQAQAPAPRPQTQREVVVVEDDEEEEIQEQTPSQQQQQQQHQQQQQQQQQTVAQKLAGNLIMDENKFADIVKQMNAHQMNRFLSILETRCGVLRNRILACTEGSNQSSSFDNLF
ncbi:hypothetical protein BGX34_009917 [Mortierella sp. NVP85]|nr:hypothetical protein BGX34_009917 [Mortierella sp. NVP85]